MLVREGPRYVRELIEWGAAFDRDAEGQPALGREAAHSVRRVLHARDATGRRDRRVLWQMVVDASARRRSSTMRWRCRWSTRDGACGGATFLDRDGRAAQVDREPDAARHRRRRSGVSRDDEPGDRHRRRHRDGASRPAPASPTSSSSSSIRPCSTSRARRGSCCRRRCAAKARGWSTRPASAFVQRYEPAGDLASRDLVARAIVREVQRTGAPVYPDDGASRSRLRAAAGSRRSRRRAGEPGFDLATRPHSGQSGGALRDGRRRDRPGRPHVDRRAVRRRRGRVHRRARRQPAGQQLAARGAGVRRARGGRDAGDRRAPALRCRPSVGRTVRRQPDAGGDACPSAVRRARSDVACTPGWSRSRDGLRAARRSSSRRGARRVSRRARGVAPAIASCAASPAS